VIPRIAFIAAILTLVALALWHPLRRAPVETVASLPGPTPPRFDDAGGRPRHRHARFYASGDDIVVYVAGAVNRPGLYHLHSGDRNAQAIALAGGLTGTAQPGGVNLAERASDGDEIYAPTAGEALHRHPSKRRGGRHAARPPPNASVDVNRSDAAELAAVPGIGRAIAERIVELRQREGPFASLDELLDVAGMTQTRLERARPYLREP
jgi:competence protein ComEA